MAHILKNYQERSPELRQQLKDVYSLMSEEEKQKIKQKVQEDIANPYASLAQSRPQDALEIHFEDRLFWSTYPIENPPLDNAKLRRLYCISPVGERIYLIQSIGVAEDQHVYVGYIFSPEEARYLAADYQLPVLALPIKGACQEEKCYQPERLRVVKWVDGVIDKDLVENELRNWNMFGDTIPNPHIRGDFTLYDWQVMVMDFLIPLDSEDDWIELGVQMLNILRNFNKLACHSDIKPDNILKNAQGRYYLMDMGGITTERKGYGFVRNAWSPNWTSQVLEPGQITTARNDLLELGYTLNYSQDQLRKPKAARQVDGVREIYERQNPILFRYIEYVRMLDERNIPPIVYDDLIGILRG